MNFRGRVLDNIKILLLIVRFSSHDLKESQGLAASVDTGKNFYSGVNIFFPENNG